MFSKKKRIKKIVKRRLFTESDHTKLTKSNKIIFIFLIIEKIMELITLILPSLKYIKVIKWFLTISRKILEKLSSKKSNKTPTA